MASKLGTVFVELSLDDKIYKQKLGETLTSSTATAKGIETSWRALGTKSGQYFDQQRRQAENAYTLIKKAATSTANDIVRAEQAKNAKLKALNDQQYGAQASMLDKIKRNWIGLSAAVVAAAYAVRSTWGKVSDVVMAAARYETLGVVMRVVGNNAGYTGEQMDGFAKGLEKAGISMNASRQVLTVMAQAHIDLAKSAQLARIAQDAAVIGNMNSSQALEQMIHGIHTANVRVLRTIGINVQFEESYNRVAKQLGRTSDSFSESEKAAIRTNAVIETGARIAGTYEAAMNTAGKQLLSLERHFDNVKVAAGMAFTPALAEIVEMITGAVSGLSGELSGRSRDAIHAWGTNFRIVLISIEAEIMRLAMLLDKLGGSMTSAKMLLYGPGAALGIESSTKRFEAAAEANIKYENRYKKTDKALEALAIKQIGLENSLTEAGRRAAKAASDAAEKKRMAASSAARAAQEAAAITKKAGKDISDAWAAALRSMQTDIEKVGLEDFEKKLLDIDKKAEELREKFKGVPGAGAKIGAWQSAMGDEAAVEASKKDFDEYLNKLKEQKRLEEDNANAVKKRYADERAAREGAIASQIAEIDMAEIGGRAHKDTLNERINLTKDLLKIQEDFLGTIDRLKDPSGWYAQQNAINDTRKTLLTLMNDLQEASDNFSAGFQRGWTDWVNNARSAFQQGKDLATDAANTMKSSMSDVFFDSVTGKLKTWQDYARAAYESIARVVSNAVSEMIMKWALNQLASETATTTAVAGLAAEMASVNALTASYYALATAKAVSSAASVAGGVAHSGGIMGEITTTRTVPSYVFAGAPRYHSGIGPGERAAIIKNDEGVFTAGQMRALGNALNKKDEKPEVKIDIANIVSPDLLDSYLASGRGQNAMLNFISSKSGTIRRIMGTA